ncbi:MAG: hypothetical protein V4813_19395 [Gemmatimonadota bacterium]
MPEQDTPEAEAPMRVGELAELYLGNILYALEKTALSLDADLKPEDAAFYRGIGRALADAHGRQKAAPRS